MRISIVANQVEVFEERLKQLSKKLKKSLEWCFSSFYKKSVFFEGQNIDVIYVDIDIEIDKVFSVDGFTFYASVKNVADIPSVFSSDPDAFKVLNTSQVFKCPHCNKVIPNRKNKIFLKNEKGEIVAFGSSCAQKYFGSSYKFFVKGLEKLEEFKKSISGGIVQNQGWHSVIEHDQTVLCAIHAYKKGLKFVSKSNADYGVQPTVDRVYEFRQRFFWNQQEYSGRLSDQKEFDSALPEYRTILEKIYSFYEKMEAKVNFDFNLKTQFSRKGNINGILVYGVYKYFWEQEKLAAESAPKPVWNDLKAEIGQEIKDLEVTFLRCSGYSGPWGYKSFYTFVTKDREQVTIPVTGFLDHFAEPEAGDKRTFLIKKATVTKKGSWKDIPQTTLKLTRKVNIIEVVGK